MTRGNIRSKLISAALSTYNAAIFLALNVVMWRNHLWNTKKWTNIRLTNETQKKMRAKNAPISETA